MRPTALFAALRLGMPWVIAILLLLLALTLVWPYLRATMATSATEQESAWSQDRIDGDTSTRSSSSDLARSDPSTGKAGEQAGDGRESSPWRGLAASVNASGADRDAVRRATNGGTSGDQIGSRSAAANRERETGSRADQASIARSGLRIDPADHDTPSNDARSTPILRSGQRPEGELQGGAGTAPTVAKRAAEGPVRRPAEDGSPSTVAARSSPSPAHGPDEGAVQRDTRSEHQPSLDEDCGSGNCTPKTQGGTSEAAVGSDTGQTGTVHVNGDWNGHPVHAEHLEDDTRFFGGGMSRVVPNMSKVGTMYCVAYDSGQVKLTRTAGGNLSIDYKDAVVAQARGQEEAAYLLEHARKFRLVCRTGRFMTEQEPAFVNQYWIP